MAVYEPTTETILGVTVEIDGISVDGWQRVDIPASSTEPGTGNGDTWGETTYQDVEMARVVGSSDTILYDWREAIANDDSDDGLKDVEITAIGEDGSDLIKWTFADAWIKYYEPPQIDVSGEGLITERITLGYDSMDRELL